MNYEALLWMHNHKFLYDSATDLAIDCTAMLNLWVKDNKSGYNQVIPKDIIAAANRIIPR